MNKCFLYLSVQCYEFTPSKLLGLENQCQKNNKKMGITGYLYYKSPYFVQYFEGEEKNANDLMKKIVHDKRHKIEVTLQQNTILKRRFPQWHMKHIKKPPILSINMEYIILEQLQQFLKFQNNKQEWPFDIWRTVDSLATMHSKNTVKLEIKNSIEVKNIKM
ncbi:MAG: BLUF domain-containing protein [Pseudomonadota bacterium]